MRAVFLAALVMALPVFGAPNFQKLAEQLNSSERDARRDAAFQLRSLGSASKPMLPQLIVALDDPDSQVFANAAAAIAEIGADAADAIPKLIELTDSRKGRGFRSRDREQALLRAAYALSKIGPAAKSALLAGLKSDDTGIRRGAAKAFGMIGAPARDAIPGLIENLGHGDEALRRDAVEALALIGEASVEPLISSLGWPDAKVREGSAHALGGLATAAKKAIEPLLRASKEEKETAVLAAVIGAIPKVGTSHEKSVPVLVDALCDARPEIHHAAENAFVLVRPPGAFAVPAVAKLLDGPHSQIAATMLGYFGADARSAGPALLAAAKRTTPPSPAYLEPLARLGSAAVPSLVTEISAVPVQDVSRGHWALKTLAQIGGSAVPALEKELASQDASVRLAAVMILATQGSSARSVQAGVLKLAGDSEALVRAAVLEAVEPLGIASGRAVELISLLVKDPAPSVRIAAAAAAGALGPAGRPLADELAGLIGDKDPKVRMTAMKSIGSIGGGKEAASMLAAHLSDSTLRPAALNALGKLGPASAIAVPQMVALFSSAEPTARAEILRVFASIGQDARAALEVVSPALKSEDEVMRASAVSAFVAIQPDKAAGVVAATNALGDHSRQVREAAAAGISRLAEQTSDRAASAALPLIENIRKESDDRYAMDALRALRVKDPAVVAKAFTMEDEEIRMWAAERVARMGRDGQQFRPELEKMRASGSDGLRSAARRAMDALNR